MTRYFTIAGTPVVPPVMKMNIRSGASVTATDIGDLYAGDKLEVSETITVSPTDKWGKLVKVTRAYDNTVLFLTNSYVSLNTTNTIETFPVETKAVSVTVTLEGYKPLTLSGQMESETA